MKEQFITKRFSDKSMSIIGRANVILNEYAQQGFDLSLRQLYYQFVARGYIENSQKSYKNLGSVIADGRLAGLIDWGFIKDRGREVIRVSHWDSPAEILTSAARSFHLDKWEDQAYHIWVMVEKQALEGVLIPVCRNLDITFIANKGYSSASTMYDIGKQLEGDGRDPVVFYLGDHDPSGIDMTRDVLERLELFSGKSIDVRRLALNMDQVRKFNPPPNPAKEADTRFEDYRVKFGDTCWELDALNPSTLARLVEQAVSEYRDEDLWDASVLREQEMKDQLTAYAREYEKKKK